jgi:hypothetical protein
MSRTATIDERDTAVANSIYSSATTLTAVASTQGARSAAGTIFSPVSFVGGSLTPNRPTVHSVSIAGEVFSLDRVGSEFIIRHPYWSLMGTGDSASAALRDLLGEAQELRDVFEHIEQDRLDLQALQLKSFLLKLP